MDEISHIINKSDTWQYAFSTPTSCPLLRPSPPRLRLLRNGRRASVYCLFLNLTWLTEHDQSWTDCKNVRVKIYFSKHNFSESYSNFSILYDQSLFIMDARSNATPKIPWRTSFPHLSPMFFSRLSVQAPLALCWADKHPENQRDCFSSGAAPLLLCPGKNHWIVMWVFRMHHYSQSVFALVLNNLPYSLCIHLFFFNQPPGIFTLQFLC